MKTKVYGEGIRRQSASVIFGTVVLALGLLLLSGGAAQAQDTNLWASPVGGDWNTAANWTNMDAAYNGTQMVPPQDQVVYFTNNVGGTPYTVTYNAPMSASYIGAVGPFTGNNMYSSLLISNASTGAGGMTLNINAAGFNVMCGTNAPAFTVEGASSYMYINPGGVFNVITNVVTSPQNCTSNSNSTAGQISSRNVHGGNVIVNGGTFSVVTRSGTVLDMDTGQLILNSGYMNLYNPRTSRYNAGGFVQVNGGTALISTYTGYMSGNFPANGPATSGLQINGGSTIISNIDIATGSANRWSTMEVTGGLLTNVSEWGFGEGANAYGRYRQSGGTVVSIAPAINIGNATYGTNDFTVFGGNLDANKIVLVAYPDPQRVSSTFTVTNAGSVYLGSGGIVQNTNPGNLAPSNSSYSVVLGDNATLGANADWSSAANMTLIRGATTFDAENRAHTSGQNITLSGALSGSGGLIKSGGGNLNLSAVNTYSGNTTIGNGTLAIIGGGSINNTPIISVAQGAELDVSTLATWMLQPGQTLKGQGVVNGIYGNGGIIVAHGATLAPGDGVGTLQVAGDITLKGDLSIRVDGAAVLSDMLDAGTYDGTLDLSDSGSSATFTWLNADPGNNTYVIATYGTLIGTFGTTNNLPAQFSIDYDYEGNNEIALTTLAGVVVPVPEPSSLMLAGLGLLGAYLVGRRTRK
jgi:autotransporter-associated beta strand protein